MGSIYFLSRYPIHSFLVLLILFFFNFSSPVWGQEAPRKKVEPYGPATWLWLPDEFRARLAHAQQSPWRESADEVLIPRSQIRRTTYLNSLLKLPVWIDLGGAFRIRHETLTNPFRKGTFGTDNQLPLRTRVRLGLNSQVFRFLFEFQDSRSLFVDDGEFESSSVTNKAAVIQLFGSATFRNLFGTGVRTDIHFGRYTMDVGRRRLIARNRFRNTTNNFDGAHLNLRHKDFGRLRAFLVNPVTRDLDGVDVAFGTSGTLFWGLNYGNRHLPSFNTDVYYFGLNARPGDINELRQYSTFGFRLFKGPKRQAFDYELEPTLQFGTAGTPQGKKDHFAYMFHAQLGHTFKVMWTPRLLFQYDYASGTRDPNGSQNGTFDRLFGARNWELMPTGIFGAFSRSNISSPRARIYFSPMRRVAIMVKYGAWWLAQAKDAWVGTGLQDPTGRSGNFLGQDIELRVRWRPIRNVRTGLGYDRFIKGSYVENLAKVPGNPPADDSNYFYVFTELFF